jgi:HPt (histidine-containing phosphotransfer) domain-containing protein
MEWSKMETMDALAFTTDSEQPIQSAFADDEIVTSLLSVFLEELRTHLAAMQAALASGDFACVARLAHKARGAAATYGYPHLSEELLQLESCAAVSAPDAEDVGRRVAALPSLVRRIAVGIESHH